MVDKIEDIRWKQRFSNYTNAFEQLQEVDGDDTNSKCNFTRI
jgi:hypothetical protein